MTASETTMVLGGTGKTGRRIVERLSARGLPVRVGSRTGEPPFEWTDPGTWAPALRHVESVYIAYYPDLASPGAAEAIQSFANTAVKEGVQRLVLLSGRGEEEAERCEDIIRGAGADWTILRASWFSQNFSENFLRELIVSGVVALSAGDIGEPFIDAEDIADVAVAALTEEGHAGRLYEITGPRLLTFSDAVGEIAAASGRNIQYVKIPHDEFISGMESEGAPRDLVTLVDYLFRTVLDGRNAHLNDGVAQALGRPPRDFADYARGAAAAGCWSG